MLEKEGRNYKSQSKFHCKAVVLAVMINFAALSWTGHGSWCLLFWLS